MAQHNGHILKVLLAKCADQYQVASIIFIGKLAGNKSSSLSGETDAPSS
jgi:hypothetical protein